MGTIAVTVILLRMITTPDRHANLVLHVRMKGAILGSVDLAMQVPTIRLVHTTRFVIYHDRAKSGNRFYSESARIRLVPIPNKCLQDASRHRAFQWSE